MITKEDLDGVAQKAVNGGQFQLASILASVAVMVEHNDAKVLHELAHHCAEHVIAGRRTHGLVAVETGVAPRPSRAKHAPHKPSHVTDIVAEEPVEAVVGKWVSVLTPNHVHLNGEVIKAVEDSTELTPAWQVKLVDGTVVQVDKVYAPR